MPTYPEKENESFTSSGGIPIVHSLGSATLKDYGWTMQYSQETITVPTYTKDGKTVTYKFGKWFQDGREIYFIEDIK